MLNEDSRNQALSEEEAWWSVGHSLYEASEMLKKARTTGPFLKSFTVGGPTAGMSGGTYGLRWRRRLISEMLYAFAVENWLKGLLVAGAQRSSDNIRLDLNDYVDQATADIESLDVTISTIAAVLSQGIGATKLAASDKQVREENAERLQRLKEHKTHNLERLAEAAGLTLTLEDREYLVNLSHIVQVGRYPAHNTKDVGDLRGTLGLKSPKRRLNLLIKNRYDELKGLRFGD